MSYSETVNYLFQKLPIYQRKGAIAYKKDIGNIIKASKILKDPHRKFKSIHIAGTNGKGSTAHMISSILQESNYTVGLYTSPHLKDFRERIKINGKMISKKSVIDFVKQYKTAFEKINMSFFEFTVAMAFYYFSKKKVDIAIIETGLGGRLDSTNIISPLVSIITNIGFDHTALLGDTIKKISIEKAGIIKKNTPVIIGKEQKECKDVFIKKSQENNSSIIFCSGKIKYQTDLKGNYQSENIRTALFSIKELKKHKFKISEKDIKNGFLKVIKNTSLLGRWQILQKTPLTICDIAHNKDGMKSIVKQLYKLNYNNLHFIIGTVNDKNIESILKSLPKKAKYYFCQANIPRSLDKKLLQSKSNQYGLKGKIYNSVPIALKTAQENAKENDCIFIGGSTFVVAEII